MKEVNIFMEQIANNLKKDCLITFRIDGNIRVGMSELALHYELYERLMK